MDILLATLAIIALVMFFGMIAVFIIMSLKCHTIFWMRPPQNKDSIIKGECPVDIEEIIRQLSE